MNLAFVAEFHKFLTAIEQTGGSLQEAFARFLHARPSKMTEETEKMQGEMQLYGCGWRNAAEILQKPPGF